MKSYQLKVFQKFSKKDSGRINIYTQCLNIECQMWGYCHNGFEVLLIKNDGDCGADSPVLMNDNQFALVVET